MLRKLMKYDLKYYRKIMLPLWAVLIIYGIVHGINTVFNYETFYPNKGTGYCCCDRYLFYILREYYSCDTKVLEKHVWKGKLPYTYTSSDCEKVDLVKGFQCDHHQFYNSFYLFCRK